MSATNTTTTARSDDLRSLLRVLLLLVGLCVLVFGGWAVRRDAEAPGPSWVAMRELRTQLLDGAHVSLRLTLQPAQPDDAGKLKSLLPGLEAVAMSVVNGRRAPALRGGPGVGDLQDDLQEALDDYLAEHRAPTLAAVLVDQLVIASNGSLPLP